VLKLAKRFLSYSPVGCPNRKVKCDVIGLADVVASYDGNEHDIKKTEVVVLHSSGEASEGDVRFRFYVG
jgi:hypothetical protein